MNNFWFTLYVDLLAAFTGMNLKALEKLSKKALLFGRNLLNAGEMWELRLARGRVCRIFWLHLLPGCTRLNARSGFPLLEPEDWIKQANEPLLGDLADVSPAVEKDYGHIRNTTDTYPKTMQGLSIDTLCW